MLHVPLGVSPKFQGTSEWGEYRCNSGTGPRCRQTHGFAQETWFGRKDDCCLSDNGRGPGRNKEQTLIGGKIST